MIGCPHLIGAGASPAGQVGLDPRPMALGPLRPEAGDVSATESGSAPGGTETRGQTATPGVPASATADAPNPMAGRTPRDAPPRRDGSTLVSILVRPSPLPGGLARTLGSLVDQTWQDWEAIVLGTGAGEGAEEGGPRCPDPRVRHSPTPAGASAAEAFDRALDTCRGAWIGSVEAGDRLHPSRLELQLAALDGEGGFEILGTEVEGPGPEAAGPPRPGGADPPGGSTRLDAWFDRPLEFSSLLVRRDAYRRVGGLDPALPSRAPKEFLARCLALGLRTSAVPAPRTSRGPEAEAAPPPADRVPSLVEEAYIFSAHLAPVFLRAGRHDLFARALDAVAGRPGPGSGGTWTAVLGALRLLIGWSAGFPAFRNAFLAASGAGGLREPPGYGEPRPAAPRPRPPGAGRSRPPLVILDDFFPNPDSAFRVAEFNDYLETFDCEVLSTNPDFATQHRRYAELFPRLAARVKPFGRDELAGRAAAYLVFIHNAWRHLPDLEAARLPFAYTLYPGVELFDPAADLTVQAVSRSRWFHRLLATQHVTLDYVLERQLGDPARAEFVWGITVPTRLLELPDLPRRRYGRDKGTVDVCFTAHRYMPGGIDKGYDLFVETARLLAREDPAFRFHVVGGMTPAEAPLGELSSRFVFHPPQPTDFFPDFYRGIDVILSPNRPFRRRAGGFDGFPTGCSIDAALCGVAIACTDPFGENRYFRPGEELLVVPPDPEAIAASLRLLPREPQAFEAIGAAGRSRCRELYSVRAQLEPRRAMLRSLLAAAGSPA